jgi:hypothetical protein
VETTDPRAEAARTATHQPAVYGDAGADHHVKPFLDHIDQSIGEVEIEQDCRMGFHEVRNDGHQEHTHERQADAKPAARRGRGLPQLDFRRLDLLEDAATSVEEEPPFHGQRHAAGVATEQAHPEASFETRDGLLADGWRRRSGMLARCDEAARFRGLHECAEGPEVVRRP